MSGEGYVHTASDPRALDRASPMPLWAQLQQDLTRRLGAGAFDTGFPGEMELVAAYEVSRHTVREALRRLREAGVLDSARGRGTVVRRDIEQPLGSLYSLFREVEARGMVQASIVLAQRIETDPAAAQALGLAPGELLFHLERIRLVDGEPLAHDRVWLPGALAGRLMEADFTRSALYDELAARCGVRLTGGRERISATASTPEQATLLGVPRGVACLTVERTGCVEIEPVEWRVTVIRGDRYSVIADWSNRGYSLGAAAGPGRRPVTSAG
jgi:GntR family transcriptional regulator